MKNKNDPYGCDETDNLEIQACSAQDCTGLIPSLPANEDELESYEDLYHFPGSRDGAKME